MGIYAADGSWNITVVAGTSPVGRYAADGSMNVVESDGLTSVGLCHPCGAVWVTLNNSTSAPVGFYAPDGSMNVTDDGTPNGATRVTVVSGALSGGAPDPLDGLLEGEEEGYAIDATVDGGSVTVVDLGTPANDLTEEPFATANLVRSGSSSKLCRLADGTLLSRAAGVIPQSYDPVAGQYGILIEPAATNIRIRGISFDDSNWTKNGTTVSSSAETLDNGNSTVDALIEDTGNTAHNIQSGNTTVTASTTYTVSIFLKDNGRPHGFLRFQNTANSVSITVPYNLAAGTLGTESVGGAATYTSKSITPYADGWYRISLTGILSTVTVSRMHVGMEEPDDTTTYTGDGVSGVLLWGAQIELGTVATSLIYTFGGGVTRLLDNITIDLTTLPFSATEGTIYVDALTAPAVPANQVIWQLDDTTANERMLGWRDTSNNPTTSVVDGGASQVADDGGTLTSSTRVQHTFAYTADDFDISWDGAAPTSDTSGTLPTVTTLRLGRDHSASGWNGLIYRLVYVPRQVETEDGDLENWRYNFVPFEGAGTPDFWASRYAAPAYFAQRYFG